MSATLQPNGVRMLPASISISDVILAVLAVTNGVLSLSIWWMTAVIRHEIEARR